MGLARPASSATPTVAADTTVMPPPVPTCRPAPRRRRPRPRDRSTAAPPVALTARPQRPGDDTHDGRPGGAHQWQSLSTASGSWRATPTSSPSTPPAGALTEAQQMLERIEQRWSRFLPDSDISRINLADGRPVGVDPLTLTLDRHHGRGLAGDAGPLRPHHPAGPRRRRVPIQHRPAVTGDDPASDHAAPRRASPPSPSTPNGGP